MITVDNRCYSERKSVTGLAHGPIGEAKYRSLPHALKSRNYAFIKLIGPYLSI